MRIALISGGNSPKSMNMLALGLPEQSPTQPPKQPSRSPPSQWSTSPVQQPTPTSTPLRSTARSNHSGTEISGQTPLDQPRTPTVHPALTTVHPECAPGHTRRAAPPKSLATGADIPPVARLPPGVAPPRGVRGAGKNQGAINPRAGLADIHPASSRR